MKKLLLFVLLIPGLGCYHKVARPVVNVPPGLIEAPQGFDTLTNGFVGQQRHDDDRDQFEEDAVLPQLGPAYNARACADCHDTPNCRYKMGHRARRPSVTPRHSPPKKVRDFQRRKRP